MSRPDPLLHRSSLSVKKVNQVLAEKGFNLKKGDAHKVFDLLKTTPEVSVFEAAARVGIERPKHQRSTGSRGARRRVPGKQHSKAGTKDLIRFLVDRVVEELARKDITTRFLQLVAEEAAEGTAPRLIVSDEQGHPVWTVEDSGRPHVLAYKTIEEFINQPAQGYTYEGDKPSNDDMIRIAGEIIEEIFSETIDHVLDTVRDDGPDWAKALLPKPRDVEKYEDLVYENLADELFDAVNERKKTYVLVDKLSEIAAWPFKETIARIKPEIVKRLQDDTQHRLVRDQAIKNAQNKVADRAEAIRKELIGATGMRLPRKAVPGVVNKIIGHVSDLEGLFLALGLLRHERIASCLDRTAQPLLEQYLTSIDAAFSTFPVSMEAPLSLLFLRLNDERTRLKRRFVVTAIDQSGTIFTFDEDRWAYFMAWALTGALASTGGLTSVVIRREESLMDAERAVPIKTVAALIINGIEVHKLSSEEMYQMHTTDAQTGESLEPEPGVRCVAFSSLLPGLFEPSQI